MPSQKNIHQLGDISKSLTDAKAVILTDYSGLSVAAQSNLRNKIRDSGGIFTVAKNNLLRLALKDKFDSLPRDIEDVLQGPTAVMFALDDAVTSAKALMEFVKENELPQVKIGLLEDKILTKDEIIALSKLPGREQLLATLMAQLNAPMSGFVRQISAPMQRLVYALTAINNTKS
ncbi:50S ribosomal protein L10 [Candidatus Collierbacteria bacterium]|nr:50S ribosomal protein L10 [Candidatus Collierbacteria bacterium]